MVVATGFFDGVHIGHRDVLKRVTDIAGEIGVKSGVITFWPHPRNVLQQDASDLRLLNTLEEKRELILDMGIDEFIQIPFSKEFSRLTTREFMSLYLVKMYGVTDLVLGYDHRLGCDTDQNREQLISIASSLGIRAYVVDAKIVNGKEVSSTVIRDAISRGAIESATALLGYNYKLSGVVVAGNKIGRTIGYPTANMQLYEPLKLLPENGVYASDVYVMGRVYKGATNIGVRPTVNDSLTRTIETHILDFSEDIYGLDIEIKFHKRIREEYKFNSLKELRTQLGRDVVEVREFFR